MDTIFFLGVGSWLIAWGATLGLHGLARASPARAAPLTLFDALVIAPDMETT